MGLFVSNQQDKVPVDRGLEELLARTASLAFAAASLPPAAEVGVALVDDERIREMNRTYRGIDEPTDVLAFAHGERGQGEPWPEPGSEGLYLGDVAISLETASRQAAEQGHDLAREMAWLLAHGILHLAGYDHDLEPGARLMRAKEREILEGLRDRAPRRRRPAARNGLAGERARAFLEEQGIAAEGLLDAAWEARKSAYAPYSGFAVGAALLGCSGRVYQGCNVENASYGLTLCAERSALAQAVLGGERGLAAVAVVAQGREVPVPCGACCQALAEFSRGTVVILQRDRREEFKVWRLRDLLPIPFGWERYED
jgi:probable rRNA maturation factor